MWQAALGSRWAEESEEANPANDVAKPPEADIDGEPLDEHDEMEEEEQPSAQDNLDLFKNNNATEWHSISMLTEADFDDDDEGDVINYNNTHPELMLKAFSQAIEDSEGDVIDYNSTHPQLMLKALSPSTSAVDD